jgi:hypothetical protein
MPDNNIQNDSTAKRKRESARKAPGTRLGVWEDWREGSSRSRKMSSRHGYVIRDGR